MIGYRNIYYNSRSEEITLWTWDQQGNRITEKHKFQPYLYVESANHKDAISIYNTNLRKVTFKNQFERSKYVKSSGVKRLFHNIQTEQQFLVDYYGNTNKNLNFSKFPLRIFYLDIETYSKEFPEPSIAKDPINVITIFDTLTQKYYSWGSKPHTPKDPNTVYQYFSNEGDMFRSFIKFWRHSEVDCVSGWNIHGFDIPYIINRINNVLGEGAADKLSPVDQLYKKEGVLKNIGGKLGVRWFIKGVTCLDYLDVYITFTREKRESYALNNIAEIELGEGKLHYNATSLTSLADNNWDQFIEYNHKDVELLIRLEDKLQYLAFCRTLSYMGLASLESSLGTITIVTGAMVLKAKEHGKIISTFITNSTTDYAGGFVKEPIPGLYSDIISFDVNSLYPNSIITLNISPETKLGKVLSKDEQTGDITFKLINGKEYVLKKDKFFEFLKKESIAISSAKILFSQKNKGICPQLVDDIYKERLKIKSKLKKLENELKEHKKDTKEYITREEKFKKAGISDYSLKILLNRIYGTFANKYSPFYDIDCASSITLSGQRVIKQTSDIVNKWAKNKFGIEEELVKYGDTDSVAGDSIIRTNIGIFHIKLLYDIYSKENNIITDKFGHEIIIPSNLKCLTCDNDLNIKLNNVKKLVRHKVKKKMYKIKIGNKEIITTEDHGIMVRRNNNLIRISPKNLKVNDEMVSIYGDT